MDHLLSAIWEAHHPIKNHHRRYQIVIGRDLLNHWTLSVIYGRVQNSAMREIVDLP